MSGNPVNLAFRFLLELAGLAAIGYWGWTQHDGVWRFVLALGLPLLAAILWGTFRVPGDASSSGRASVPVPGIVLLVLELAFFAAAAWGLFDAGQQTLGLILAVAVLLHYVLSYDRVIWLLRS